MVTIVIENGDAPVFAGAAEAALDTGECRKTLADLLLRDAKVEGNRERRRRIERVVVTGHAQRQIVDVI